MKVTTVSASVRFSKALGEGQHKTVEVGAEATLDGQENWEAALAQLYADLGHELKALWGNGNGHHKVENGAVVAAEPKSEPEPIQDTGPRTRALLPGAPGGVSALRARGPGLVLSPDG